MPQFMTEAPGRGYMQTGELPPAPDDGYMWNLDAGFKQQLWRFMQASEGRITLISGYRDEAHQQRLYDAAVEKHGAENAGRWAALPGRSNHNRGLAGDLQYADDEAKKWAHENAARFGLHFPMSWEPWHIEPQGLRDGTYEVGKEIGDTLREAYTFFDGMPNPMDNVPGAFDTYAGVVQQALSLPLDTQETEGFASAIGKGDTDQLEGEESINDG